MNFKKFGITLAITAGVTGIGMATHTQTISASAATFPVHMRGVWHMYSYGSYESQRITKHSYHYYGSPKIEPGELVIGHHVNSYGRVAYVPRMSGVSGAYSYFIPGKVNWHGHKYRALYTDGGVMTHKHIRHEFKVPRSYHY